MLIAKLSFVNENFGDQQFSVEIRVFVLDYFDRENQLIQKFRVIHGSFCNHKRWSWSSKMKYKN